MKGSFKVGVERDIDIDIDVDIDIDIDIDVDVDVDVDRTSLKPLEPTWRSRVVITSQNRSYQPT